MKTILHFIIAFILIPLLMLALAWVCNHAITIITNFSYSQIYHFPPMWIGYATTAILCIIYFFKENPFKIDWD